MLDAALALADAEGLPSLSMRKLAAELGVEAMSLYNHVANKGDLLDGLAARVFESVELPDPALPWEERLRALGTGAAAAFAAHPAAIRAMAAGEANPRSPGALRLIDAFLSALLDAGLDERGAAKTYRTLIGLLFGSALRDTVDVAKSPKRTEQVDDWFRRVVTEDELPSLYRALPALMDASCAPEFADELGLLIENLKR